MNIDKFIAFMSSEWLFNTIMYFSLVVGTSAIIGIALIPLLRFREWERHNFKVNDTRFFYLMEKSTLRHKEIFLVGIILSALSLVFFIFTLNYICGIILFLVTISAMFTTNILAHKFDFYLHPWNVFMAGVIIVVAFFTLLKVLFSLDFAQQDMIISGAFHVISLTIISTMFGLRLANTSGEANALVYTRKLVERIKVALDYRASRLYLIVGPIITTKGLEDEYPPLLELLEYKNFHLYKFHRRLSLHFITNNKGGFGSEAKHTPGAPVRPAITCYGDVLTSFFFFSRFWLTLLFGFLANLFRIKKYGYTKITKDNVENEIKFITINELKNAWQEIEISNGDNLDKWSYTEKEINAIVEKKGLKLRSIPKMFAESLS